MRYYDLSPHEKQRVIDEAMPVTFTVMREGPAVGLGRSEKVAVERSGTITRHERLCIWVGAFCYHEDELLPTLRLPGGLPDKKPAKRAA